MAKKSRRARRRREARAGAKPGSVSGAEKAVKVGGSPGLARATGESLAEQYAYVYDDLKRIAILAGAMFAILIALSFLIE
jgi:aspartate/methionine/tyrosine aminotransferase